MRASQRRLQIALFLGVGLILTGVVIALYAFNALRSLDLDTVDARFSIRGEEKPPADLVVVKIDDETFQELRARWPFRRTLHAGVIDRITQDRPKVISYDVQFTEPSERESDDIALAESILNANKKVVLSTTEVNERGEAQILGPPEVLRQIGARPGNGLLPNDPGGVLRRVSYDVDKLKSLAVVTAEVAEGRQIPRSEFGGDTAWIDYYGPGDTIASVPFSRVFRGQTPRGFFRDKIVVVGPTAPTLQDVHPTSTSGDDQMSGAEIQANAVSTVLRDTPLEETPTWLDVVLIVLLGMLTPIAALRLRPLIALSIAAVVAVAYAVAAQLVFQSGTILPFVYPLGALALASVGALAIYYITTAFERERVRDLFSRFVPENVVDEVISRADEGLRLGGVQREGTVLFSDLRGFTSFAETLPVDRVIDVLNRYLTEMSDAILDNGGTLVAYMGDGIMAVFGAPVEQPDHADRAVAASREMLSAERLGKFNDYLKSEGLSETGFRMGIGLNTGPVMSGHVGSERRLEYTAIGDTTNTSARLEGMTKGTPHQLFLADSTKEKLDREAHGLIYVDEFEVRGRKAKIKLWSLEEATDEEARPAATAPPPEPVQK